MREQEPVLLGDCASIAAIITPIVVGLLTKASWPSWLKFAFSIIPSAAVGAVTVWATTGAWAWSPVFILSVIGAAEAFYNAIIKPSGLADWLASKWIKDPAQAS